MHFIDAHTHVQFASFKEDWEEVIGRALAEDVWLVNVGTQADTSRRAVEIADAYDEGVYAAVGLHPIHTGKSFYDADELGAESKKEGFMSRGEQFDTDYYRKLALHTKVVALGECGFDYFHLEEDRETAKQRQQEVFEAHIELAKETGKPLMIHCRSGKNADAFRDLIETLSLHSQSFVRTPGIVHFFSGNKEDAAKLLDMGFSFTFGGVITFTHDYDEIVKMIPSARILSETDAPYVTPAPHRGTRNEPAYVVEVVRRLAELKELSLEEMKERLWENARELFGIL